MIFMKQSHYICVNGCRELCGRMAGIYTSMALFMRLDEVHCNNSYLL